MRLFLINPPSNYRYVETLDAIEPTGLGYVGAVCRRAGHRVRMYDLLAKTAAEVNDIFVELDRFVPDVVGFSAVSETFGNALQLARAVKARYGATVVFGGWHVSGEPRAVLDPAIDYAVIGEGEDTILELLDHLEGNGPPLEEIKGIAFQRAGEVRLTAPRPRILDLDALPFPMRSGLPLERYRYAPLFALPLSRMRTLSIQASRGCPYRCSFCQTPAVWGTRWRKRSPLSVVDELEELVDVYGINTLFFRDEVFTIEPRWTIRICEEIVRRGLEKKVAWGAFARVDDITDELSCALEKAGCTYLFVGVESTDAEVGERLRKPFAKDTTEQSLRLLAARDITIHGGWIIGFPLDTREALDRAFDWLSELEMDFLSVFFATPFANTPLWHEAEDQGLVLSHDYDRYTSKEVVIRTPHIPTEELRMLPDQYMRRFHLRPARVLRQARRMVRKPTRIWVMADIILHMVLGKGFFHRYGGGGEGRMAKRRERLRLSVPSRYFVPLERCV